MSSTFVSIKLAIQKIFPIYLTAVLTDEDIWYASSILILLTQKLGSWKAALQEFESQSDMPKLDNVSAIVTNQSNPSSMFPHVDQDDLWEVASIYILATEIFGSWKKADDWLTSNSPVFSNTMPLSSLKNKYSRQKVAVVLELIQDANR